MTFNVQNWARNTTDANEPFGALQSPTPGGYTGCFREWLYTSPTDTQATVSASGYFNSIGFGLATGDLIRVYSVTENTYVTYTVTSTQGIDPTGAPTITLSVLVGALGSSQYAQVALTNAQILGMYAAPVQLVAAPGAGLLVLVDKFSLNLVFNTAAFANGGAVAPQYSATIDGGGQNTCSATIAASVLTGFSANEIISLTGITAATVTNSTGVSGLGINQGIYLSNASAAFTNASGGTSTALANIWYRIVAAQ